MDETPAVIKGDGASTDILVIAGGAIILSLIHAAKQIYLSNNAIKIARINNGLVNE